MSLDPRTLTYVLVLVAAFLGGALFLIWLKDQKLERYAFWAAGNLSIAAGWLLIGLRGGIPDSVSMVVGSPLIAMGYGLILAGIQRFQEKEIKWKVPAAIVVMVFAGQWIWVTIKAPVDVRIVFVLSLFSIQVFQIVKQLKPEEGQATLAASKGTRAIFALNGITFLATAIYFAIPNEALSGLFAPPPPISTMVIVSLICVVGWSMGFMAMTNQQQQAEIIDFNRALESRITQHMAEIHERGKEREKSIEQFRARFQDAIESMADGVLWCDKDENIIAYNDSFKKSYPLARDIQLGMRLEEWIGYLHTKGHYKDVGAGFVAERMRNFRALETVELKEIGHNRQTRWILARHFRARDGGTFLVRFDITERKNHELELIKRERQLNEAQAIAHLGSWAANILTGELTWSDEIYRIFGYEPGSITPSVSTFLAAVHPEDLNRVRESEKKSRQTGTHDVIHRIIRPDGTVRHVHELAKAETNEAGALLKLSGTVQDVTDEVVARQLLEESKNNLKLTLESTADGIMAVDQTRGIVFGNERFRELWRLPHDVQLEGISSKQILTMVKDQLVNPGEFQAKTDAIYNSDREQADICEFKDGRIYERYSIPISGTGKMGRVWSFRDVTEKKAIERQLLKAKGDAEAANRSKSAFLANMSHELRTPLNAIIGFSDVLSIGTFGLLNKKQTDYVGEINKSGLHLLSIINDVLDLSAIEAGKMVLRESRANLGAILNDAMSIVTASKERDCPPVHVTGQEDLPILLADEGRLKQIFVNLLSNAAKFTSARGSIALAARQSSDGSLRVSIADSGTGMSAEEIESALSSRFSYVNPTTRERGKGSGLGLIISRELIQRHGGDLLIESVKGVGTTVTVVFPPDRVVRG